MSWESKGKGGPAEEGEEKWWERKEVWGDEEGEGAVLCYLS